MVTKKDRDLLASQLGFIVSMADATGTIPEKRRQQMAASLADFCCHAIIKYAAGQKEHGGDILDRDLKQEMVSEHIDMFWYQSAQQWTK